MMDDELEYKALAEEYTPVLLLSEIEDNFNLEDEYNEDLDAIERLGSLELKQSCSSLSSINIEYIDKKLGYNDVRLELDDKGRYSIDSIADVCIHNIKDWKSFTRSDLIVKSITLGTSSTLFSIEINSNLKAPKLKKVFFRIYNSKVYELYDNSFENEVFETMAKCKLGPKLIAYTYGARIEEWIDGNVLTFDQLHNLDILKEIAKLIAVLHRKLHTKVAPLHWDRNPSLIRYLNRWSNGSLRGPLINQKRVNLQKWIKEKDNYCEALKKYVNINNSLAFTLGFCHNDIHENNILIDNKGRFRMVDFEYSGFNYVGCDIGNVIVEFMIDYCSDSPSRYTIHHNNPMDPKIKREFVAFYISHLQDSKVDPDNAVVNEFMKAVDVLILGLHLLWGFWSVLRASAAPIEKPSFNYIKYANERFMMYTYAKNSLESDFIQYYDNIKNENN